MLKQQAVQVEMVPAVAVPGDLGGADHAADSESPPVAQAPGPAVPGPTGCQSAPGMTQRVHPLIRLVSKGMPDCECGEQNLMADAVPESICMNQSSPLDSWSTLSADIDYEHLAHRLEPQCYRPLIYRLALVPSPICITDNWPSPPVEAGRGLREQQRMDGSDEAPNCRDFICQCSSRAVASSFTTGPPSDSSPFIKETI